MRIKNAIFALSAILWINGCGGGGTSTEPTTPTDTTSPTAIVIMSDYALAKAETATVTITFSEAVSGFENGDVVAQNGILGTFTSIDSAVWKATFTPMDNLADNTNIITLANTYTDVAGNVGTVATSANYTINTTVVTEDDTTTIDVLALYTKEADESVAEGAQAKITHFFALANTINKDSGIDLKYNIVHMEESTLIDENMEIGANLDNITYAYDKSADGLAVEALRDKYKADEVVGYLETARNCGNAWMNDDQDPDYAFAMVPVDCPADSTAHEVGHNLGLNHSHLQEDEGQFPFSVGYGVDEEFVTVMAYSSFFGDPDTELYYSNPTIVNCGIKNNLECGVPIGNPEQAYAAESIRRTMEDVSKFK